MVELTVLATIGWHNKLRILNLQCCPEPTLFCFLPGVSWRTNHQSCHWCRKRHIVSRIAILLHCRIEDLLSPLSSARLWCLVSVSRWLVLIYMCKYMGLHLGLQDMSELMASLLTTVPGWSLAGRFICALGSARVWGSACSPYILACAVGIDSCVLSLALKRLRRWLWLSQKGAEGKCRLYICKKAQQYARLISHLNSNSTVAQSMKLEREKSLTVQICKSIV